MAPQQVEIRLPRRRDTHAIIRSHFKNVKDVLKMLKTFFEEVEIQKKNLRISQPCEKCR